MRRECPRCGTIVDEQRIRRTGRPVGSITTPVEVRRRIAELAAQGFSTYWIRKTLRGEGVGMGFCTVAKFRNWTE